MRSNLFLLFNGFYRLIFVIFYFFSFCSCNFGQSYPTDTINLSSIEDSLITALDSIEESNAIDTLQTALNFVCGPNYSATKKDIVKLRSSLMSRYNMISDSNKKLKFLDSIMQLFVANLLNEIIPYWYGTEWDFEGHTDIPNNGQIACGYFVSTTLKDMGLKLNRYRLAQADPLTEARTLAIADTNLKKIDIEDFNSLADFLDGIQEGLYFIGLDNHVGYFYKKGNKNYFIHSNYVDGKVMIELAENSLAFSSSNYYLTKISLNREMALKWVSGKRIN